MAASRPLLWLVLALPGLWILYRRAAAPDVYGYGHAIGDSGDWAAWLRHARSRSKICPASPSRTTFCFFAVRRAAGALAGRRGGGHPTIVPGRRRTGTPGVPGDAGDQR